MEGLLAVVGLEMTTEGVRTGTGMERWRERVPGFRGCNAEAARARSCADKGRREEISVGESSRRSSRPQCSGQMFRWCCSDKGSFVVSTVLMIGGQK